LPVFTALNALFAAFVAAVIGFGTATGLPLTLTPPLPIETSPMVRLLAELVKVDRVDGVTPAAVCDDKAREFLLLADELPVLFVNATEVEMPMPPGCVGGGGLESTTFGPVAFALLGGGTITGLVEIPIVPAGSTWLLGGGELGFDFALLFPPLPPPLLDPELPWLPGTCGDHDQLPGFGSFGDQLPTFGGFGDQSPSFGRCGHPLPLFPPFFQAFCASASIFCQALYICEV
jgi:hypothetical protein